MLRFLALALLLSLCGANAQPLLADSARDEQIGQLLHLLVVDDMLAQLPVNARGWAEALAREHSLGTDQAAALEAEVAKRIDVAVLRQRLVAEIGAHCDEQQSSVALRRLAASPIETLRSAARFPANAGQRAEFDSYTQRMRSEPPLPGRVEAVSALLGANHSVEQLLLINGANQRLVEEVMRQHFAVAPADFGAATEHVRQQTAAVQRELLQTHSRDLYIYALRFTEQQDIDAVTAALNDPTVRWFVELALQALQTVLAATPPDPAQSP